MSKDIDAVALSNTFLFGAFTNLFVLGWFAIVVASFLSSTASSRRYLLFVGGRVIPLVLLAVFVLGWLFTRGMPGDITSYSGVLTSFSIPEKVLSAWFEILGLALLVARWIVDNANETKTPQVIVMVSLVGTFVAAAIGLLFYLAASFSWRKIRNRTQAT